MTLHWTFVAPILLSADGYFCSSFSSFLFLFRFSRLYVVFVCCCFLRGYCSCCWVCCCSCAYLQTCSCCGVCFFYFLFWLVVQLVFVAVVPFVFVDGVNLWFCCFCSTTVKFSCYYFPFIFYVNIWFVYCLTFVVFVILSCNPFLLLLSLWYQNLCTTCVVM